MIRTAAMIASLIVFAYPLHAAESELFDGSHAAGQQCLAEIIGTANVAPTGSQVFVDSTQSTAGAGQIYAPPVSFSAPMANTAATYYQIPFASSTSNTQINDAPYLIGSASYGGPGALHYNDDEQGYATIIGAGQLQVWAYDPTVAGGSAFPSGSYPQVDVANITTCTDNSASNYGQEFCLGGVTGNAPTNSSSPQCKNFTSTDSPSNSTAELSQMFAAFYYEHNVVASEGFNLFDIRAAFRQTAGNWSTGYSVASGGFGVVNYNFSVSGAASLTSPSQVFLQGPGMIIENHVFFLTVKLFPFKTTRAAFEEVYSVSSSYTFPVKNELTASDIAASGATLIFSNQGTDPVVIFDYQVATSGTVTLFAVEADGAGNFSRVESFTEQQAALETTTCLQ